MQEFQTMNKLPEGKMEQQRPPQMQPQALNQVQILEQTLSFNLQQHGLKDKLIEDLQKQNTELLRQLSQNATTMDILKKQIDELQAKVPQNPTEKGHSKPNGATNAESIGRL